MYIFLIKSSLGPFSTTWVAFPRVGYGRERFLYLRIVRDVCRGFLLRIFPSLDAREPLSFFSLSSSHRGSTASTSSSLSLRGSPHLSRRKRTIQSLAISSHDVSRAPRALLPLYARELVLCVATRERSRCVCVSRRLLSFIAVVGPENLTRVDAFAPPAPLRVTGICKSIYL